ncbi:amino acid adenylation domain-containing protein [Streptomyces sp. NPDC013978]|uniref:amino acid adenylation domain-containing protein n=1 Tax=Streptomyces sp. NPDC013978 TaxID=3364869 RepID=UPI0036FBDB4B
MERSYEDVNDGADSTLLDVLLDAARETPDQTVVHVRGDGGEHTVTFAELRDDALRVAGGLLAAGVTPGTPLPLVADRGDTFQPLFWGALAAGAVPVPLAPEPRRIGPVWELLGRPPVLTDTESTATVLTTLTALTTLADESEGYDSAAGQPAAPLRVLRLNDLRLGRPPQRLARPAPHDIAFLQFSSGSTGAPKGVELTHAGVLANLRQIRTAMAITSDDVLATWMPYFHDMGLIGTHLVPMAARVKQIRIEPLSFAKRPALWFEAVDRHRATLLSAANFALALAVRRVPAATLAGLDLGCVRLLLVGAEPIAPRVWREFTALTAPAGLDPRAPLPVYGLAEATLAVTVPPLGETATPLVLDRAALAEGRVVDARPGPHAVELMDLGRPVAGCEIRITDDTGAPAGESRVGHVEVRGLQLGRGYHRAPEASAAAFGADGWLRTGDLGFLRRGRLCVTGRHKDVVFVNGRTFHASDLEETVAATPGLPPGAVAVVGSTDPDGGGERVVAFVPWARPERATAAPVLRAAAGRLREALGHDDVRVLPLPPGAIARTTSGKLRRGVLRERFEAGEYAAVEERWGGVARGAVVGAAAAGARAATAAVGAGVPRSPREVREAVREVWARVLEVPVSEVGSRERFYDLGGSSLKAMAVLGGLEDVFGVTVEPGALRDHDTVAGLAGYVVERLAARGEPFADAPGPVAAEHARAAQPPSGPVGALAVLSVACRFPGVDTPEDFWELLTTGADTVGGDAAGRLPDPGAFDARFFGMDDAEARATDPQARIFLELAHEALERAGYAGPRRVGRTVGVFAATGDSGYREILAEAADGDLARHPAALTGNLPNLIPARVSQVLDLDGPALAVDTACSSALVALHLARRSLLSGECDLAVVGGVNMGLTPTGRRLLAATGALSPTGRCRAFGTDADGFVPGEGGAALVLARLDDARTADDPVLALVRGTAVNNDGRSLGLLAPTPRGQREVIGQAYEECGVDPADVTYVEAHGTGTPIGDPVEARSLGQAFPSRADGVTRRLGSVKTNVGHLLNAAGMPALVKVALALTHRRLPPSPHATPPAPFLADTAPGFRLVTEQEEWTSPDGRPLTAGINSFGFGGTNAHAILEEAPGGGARPGGTGAGLGADAGAGGAQPVDGAAMAPYGGAAPVADGPHLLTLSARTEGALRAAAAELAAHLRDHPELDEGDVCATVNTARDEGPYRLAVVAEGDLADRLETGRTVTGPVRGRSQTVFVMPGQGVRQVGIAGELWHSAPVFRNLLEEASSLTGPVLGRSLAAWCLDDAAEPEALARTEVAQPLLVAFGVALAGQLAAWGVAPDAVVGHSVGEITAACVAGALTLAEAVGFAAERGRLMGGLTTPGAMAAVRGDEETVATLVADSDGTLTVAAVNSPTQVVLSGEAEAVDRAVAALTARGVAARRLPVSHAFHSPLLNPVLDPLHNAAKALTVHPATVPMLSTVTGHWAPDLTPDSGYWRDHAIRPVRFGPAIARLLDEGYDTFVELGPGTSLSAPIRAVTAAHPAAAPTEVTVLPAPAPGEGPTRGAGALLETVGRLWVRGTPLSPTSPARNTTRRRVPVPTYPFQRAHHWPRRLDTAPEPAAASEPQRRPAEAPAPGALPTPRPLLWRDAPLTAAPAPRAVRLTGADTPLRRSLADRLTARGVTVLNSTSTQGPYGAGAEVAPALGPTPEAVLWFAGGTTSPESEAGTAISALRDVLTALGTPLPGPTRLLLVTENAYSVEPGTDTDTDTDTDDAPAHPHPHPEQALLHGFALALAEEQPGLTSLSVDLSAHDPLDDQLAAVERELCAEANTTGTVAWRAARRLIRVATAPPPPTPSRTPLPPNGTYLITGGAGGLGSALAHDLAERGTPTLVLTGRTPTPPRTLLNELRALGAHARYQAADITDADAVDELVAGLPPLDAVFHAAGTARPGSLRGKPDDEIEAVLAAKVRGTRLLAEALRRHGQEGAVCVAFSSVSAVLPGLAGALGDYAAANAFLDAFTTAERAAGRPWQSIAFGPVSDTGLAGGTHSPAHRHTPMTAREALTALHTALTLNTPHVLITATAETPSAARMEAAGPIGARGPDMCGSAAWARSATTHPQPPTHTTPRAIRRHPTSTDAATVIRHLLADALHRPPQDIGDDEPFLTLGLDSLSAVDLARRLERELDRPLPATLLFEHRTITELATHLATTPPTPTPQPELASHPTPPPPYTPLTPLQLAFHTTETLHEGLTAYGYVRQSISGPLDTTVLGHALAHLSARHPMLRMRITDDGTARPSQYAAPAGPLDTAPRWYEIQDHLDPHDLHQLEHDLCNRPFDLRTEDPVRAVVVPEDTHLTHLLLVVHHAAADGFSLKLMAEELWSLYTELTRAGDRPQLPTPQAHFTDYAATLTAERQSPAYARDLDHWRTQLAAHAPSLPSLPYDGDPEAPPAPPLTHHRTDLDEELTAALRETAARHGVSLFHLLLAVYGRCLARWSGRRAVAVNVARARRESPIAGIDRLVGPLADTLPVFVDIDPAEPVTALADRLRRIWREAEAHATLSSVDFARLLSEVRPATGPAPRTVAEAGFSFARFPVVHGPDWPVTVTPTAAATASAATRLGLLCWEAGAALRLSWNHPAHLFRPETVRRLADEYVTELRAATTATIPTTPAPATADTGRGGIVDRLRTQFRATPQSLAVTADDGTTLTYAALDATSAALATRLRAHGVRPGDLVGLLTEPGGTATVTGVVGILRAGAGWVPLDATHPTARHRDQLSRTGVRVLVCDPATHGPATALDDIALVPVPDLDTPRAPEPTTAPQPTTDAEPIPSPDPDAIAYVIFTSGSTGRPKAVPITHRSMTNYLDWSLATFGYGPGDRLAQTASACFDASVRQLLAPLLVGATVHTLSRDLLRDPEALLDHVVADRITVWSSVPTLWERLLTAAEEHARRNGGTAPDLSALRWVHVGGEALPAAHVRRWFDLTGTGERTGGRTNGRTDGRPGGRPGGRIANLYGPTETTINATCHIIDTRPADDVRHLPIGRPITGTELTVIGEDGHECATGEPGELLITGTGLTPGYLGDPHLTAAAFTERDGRRWYRSGDRVRRTADGVLEFLGRLDDQVKVRGHRVELGEIEAALLTHPGVSRAAVLLRDGRLDAYVEPRTTATLDPREVRGFLSRTLPPYMLPARVHSLPALPLTGTGKIDRNRLAPRGESALPDPRRTQPATPTERLLARIWSELLETPASEISREDDFFTLGGDSITVLELFSRLRRERPALPRPTALYTHRTLSALATAIDTTDTTAPPEAPTPTPSPLTPYPLTPSQQGFLLADALASGVGPNPAWLARFRIDGALDPELFQRAVDVLMARHPMLRTVFPAGARPPVQQELPASLRLPVATETLAHPGLLEERTAEEASRRFEPWAWPLFRLRLFTLAPDEHVLLVHAHHLIGDGYSAALLTRELLTVYGRFERGLPHGLEPLTSTFRDHVLRRTTPARTPALAPAPAPAPAPQTDDDYRARHHTPYTPPVLHTHSVESTPAFHTATLTLDADRTRALRSLARTAGTTLHAPVLTAYYRALATLTGRRDLVLGLAVTGRDETVDDAHRVFGPFAEAVALRPVAPSDSAEPAPGFTEDLRRIAAETLAARATGPLDLRTAQGLPRTAQFFFTFLDFGSLDAPPDTTLSLRADDGDTELAPPPVGTDVFLAVRPSPDGEGLSITARASSKAMSADELTKFARELRGELEESPGRRDHALDAALIGYLPAPHHLAAFAGLPAHAVPSRAQLRALLFPDGRPRVLETVTTPLGRSGFVSLPLFADELTGPLPTDLSPADLNPDPTSSPSSPSSPSTLAALTARAVDHAASLGARCVSLAGMIPSLTGYGYDVLRELPSTPRALPTSTTPTTLTTGHAATTVAVVKTVRAALRATDRELAELTLAVVGLGSIGTSSLRLLLALSPAPPARLLLCDVPGSAPRLHHLAAELSAAHPTTAVRVVESTDPRTLPTEVYESSDLIVTAVSGGPTALLDVDRLRPGTIVVDDSFPHCFDTARALERMRGERDVLIVGGGLLALDSTETHLSPDLPAAALTGHATAHTQHHLALHLPDTLASCRLESLLHAHARTHSSDTELPLIHGLVDLPRALAHWHAAEAAEVRAAPLHLLDHTVPPEALVALPPPPSGGGDARRAGGAAEAGRNTG